MSGQESQDIRGLIAGCIGVEAILLTGESRSGEPPEWDSLAHMEILTELERAYPGMSSAMPDIGRAETVREIESLVAEFLVQRN